MKIINSEQKKIIITEKSKRININKSQRIGIFEYLYHQFIITIQLYLKQNNIKEFQIQYNTKALQMKKLHLLCLIFLFGNRAISILQVSNYARDGFEVEFIILLSIILLERAANIIYSQYYIYRAYRKISLNIIQFLASLAFLDYTNMGLIRKEDLRFSHSIFISNMNTTVHFLSVVPVVFNFICINYSNGEQYYLIYPFTIFFLIFSMSLISTVYIYENQNNLGIKKCLFTFCLQFLRSYSIWSLSSQLYYKISPFLLIYIIIILLSTFIFSGITKETSTGYQQQHNNFMNNNNNNNIGIQIKKKVRFMKVLIAQSLMLVLLENVWLFDKQKDRLPSIRKVAQSVCVYLFFLVGFIFKMCTFPLVNYYDIPIYIYSFACILELYFASKNLIFYKRYGPYQEAIQMKHFKSLLDLDLEKQIIEKYKNRILLTKFNLNVSLQKPQASDELKINLEQFSKHICQILFRISQNQCRISINISNEEELILSRKDSEIIFGIKRSANDFILKFLLQLYIHIQSIEQYQKSKTINIYLTNKEQLQVTLRHLEKALVQTSNSCIQPKMFLNFKEITIFNQMNSIFQQQYLMFYLYNNQISNYMPINPHAVFFDLYEDSIF